MKKRSLFIIIILIFAAGGIAMFSHRQNQASQRENKIIKKKQKDISGIENMPEQYEEKASEKGTLKELSYKVHMKNENNKTIQKKAMVYLPYNYSKNKKYNTFYLLHGYGGSYQTFLGSVLSPRTFKNVLDHMIQEGDIAPMIVVTPEYTDEYEDYYETIEQIGDEIVSTLIPEIESTYSTYTKSITKKELIASRNHRAVGGFSMGGCATWYTLKNHMEYFEYYLPMSMPLYYNPKGYEKSESINSARRIHEGIQNANLKSKKFYVFAASGTDDFMSEATKKQLSDLYKYKEFKETKDNFTNGNAMFYSWKGHKHSFKESYPYLYNGLLHFYR
ncbi:MAG: alpha/beta hydrolase-fold protein [Anaerostipes sp.]|nr:alpha/beta hydrolase-fold protein [Anaerostipes sp.]